MSRAARAVASARVCLGSSSSAESAAVVHAHATTLHDARNSWGAGGLLPVQRSTSYSLGGGRQDPTERRSTKGGVSGPAEDLRPVSEVKAGVNFRPAPGRQPGTGTRRGREGAVTPSLHLEVPDTQYVPPGRGLGIRQSMCWTKVCETAQSGMCCLTVTPELVCFPKILTAAGWNGGRGDHTRPPGLRQGTTVCVHTSVDVEQLSDHKLITPSGIGFWFVGPHPSCHLGVQERICQRE